MDDRTMLELSAKAAGMQWSTSSPITHDGLWITYPSVKTYWNPLTDDGDALRLAVELQMFDTRHLMELRLEETLHNPARTDCEILRRAITRAAAEIQLAKESK